MSSAFSTSMISWHLRYYDFSFLIYLAVCFVLIAAYLTIYCVKAPTDQRLAELKDIIDHDPVVTAALEKTMIETEIIRRRVELEEEYRRLIESKKEKWNLERQRLKSDSSDNNNDDERPPWMSLAWKPPSEFDLKFLCSPHPPSPASSAGSAGTAASGADDDVGASGTIARQRKRRRKSKAGSSHSSSSNPFNMTLLRVPSKT